VKGPLREWSTHSPEEKREEEVLPHDPYEVVPTGTPNQGLQHLQPQASTSITPRWVSIPHSLPMYASLVRENKMYASLVRENKILKMKNLRLKIHLNMIREELEEHEAFEKLIIL
jgi:hypothetical protein